jgi:hypothetical protein
MAKTINAARMLALVLASSVCAAIGCGTSSATLPSEDAGTDAEHMCIEPQTGLPQDVFCTGLYLGRDPSRLSPGIAPYVPGVTLWSDGAEKRRFLYLPAGSKIDTAAMDAWKFPIGTKAWKEFRVEGKLVETRILWKRTASVWEAGTYIWKAEGGSASLNTAFKGVILANGYEIPTLKDCDKCHHGASDRLLGVEAVALALPHAEGVTLGSLVQAGQLTAPPEVPSIVLPEDASGKASAALGYLHANCGMPCHSSRGLGDETKLVLRLSADEFWTRAGTALPPMTVSDTAIFKATLNQLPTTAAVATAFPGANRLVPGAHDRSLIWIVAHLRGKYQMPPLVSHQVDEAQMQNLAAWIDALPP